MSSHRVMHINVCTHHTHISSFYTVVMSSVAPQECWQTRHVTSREPRAPCKTEFSKRDQICGLLKLKAAGRIMALVNSMGVQSNENKTQASQQLSFALRVWWVICTLRKKTGLREEEEEGEELPSAAYSRSTGRAPLEQCLEAWCLISDEMSIIRDSAGESGAEQIWWRGD